MSIDNPQELGLIAAGSLLLLAAVVLSFRLMGSAWSGISARYVADLSRRMEELNIDRRRLDLYMRWWGVSMIGTFFFTLAVLRMPLVAPAVTYLIYLAPRYVLEYLVARRKSQLRDQLVGGTVLLANATRAGMSLADGIGLVSREAPQPLSGEFGRIAYQYKHGVSLRNAILEAKQRLKLDGFTLFAAAILVSLDRGGRITDALERIAKSLQENQRLERKLEADTQSGKKVVLILAAFPAIFLGGFYVMDPGSTGLLFSSLIGQGILLVIGGIMYGSVKLMIRILSIDI